MTTKIWGTYHRQPEACLDESLQKLGLDYVDLVLVHWPVPLEKRGDEKIPLNPDGSRALDRDWTPEQTWEQMEKLPATGKAKAIGVSNWSVPYLERLLAKAKTVPAANQVELHPFLPQHELVKFCQSKGILMQAYSPLGSSGGPVLQDELVQSIAKAHSADPAQVVVSWAAQRGVVALPKSVTQSRIETNHKLITLTDDEMLKLNELHQQEGKSVRLVSPNVSVRQAQAESIRKLFEGMVLISAPSSTYRLAVGCRPRMVSPSDHIYSSRPSRISNQNPALSSMMESVRVLRV